MSLREVYSRHMHDQRYLHEGERLLCTQRSTPAVLLRSLTRGILEAITASVAVGIVIAIIAISLGGTIPWIILTVISVILLGLIIVKRYFIFSEALLRITTERILLSEPMHLFHAPMHTIKWTQYQESEAGHKTFLDFFFGSRPLVIRSGTADARHEVHYPSLYYAEDIKHYLDKVGSLIRAGKVNEIREFIAKPRGKRDTTV